MKRLKYLWILIIFLVLSACNLNVDNEPDIQTRVAASIVAQERQLTVEALNSVVQASPTEPSPSPSASETPIPTETQLPTPDTTTVQVSIDTNCRTGPGASKYKRIGGLKIGDIAEVVGRPSSGEYIVIKNPESGADCWLWLEYATITGSLDGIPILPVPTPVPVSISGKVWNDYCSQLAAGSPPPGCIEPTTPGDPYIADGILDPAETVFFGIVVVLKSKSDNCTDEVDTDITDVNGAYSFAGLIPGEYCVSIDPLDPTNAAVLIPGGWSYPTRGDGVVTVDVTHEPEKNATDVNFGWDFQLD